MDKPLRFMWSEFGIEIGLGHVTYGVLLETLAKADISLGEIVSPRTVYFLGNDEQKRRFLPELLSGNVVSTACITEPQAGSDPRGLKTTALLCGDHYVLNGCKA